MKVMLTIGKDLVVAKQINIESDCGSKV